MKTDETPRVSAAGRPRCGASQHTFHPSGRTRLSEVHTSDTALYLTPGGAILDMRKLGQEPTPGRDAIRVTVELTHADAKRVITVDLDALARRPSIDAGSASEALDRDYGLAVLAIVHQADTDEAFLTQTTPSTHFVDGPQAEDLLRRPRLSDREIRRFIVRLVYAAYSRANLRVRVPLTPMDLLITGCARIDFERAADLLAEEGYLTRSTEIGTFRFIPTAKLVRDVERYGAARDDAVGERDYPAALTAYAVTADSRDAILLEWARYSAARSGLELMSVFRAVAPLVETVLSRVLASHGSTRAHSNLGPMIGELQQRGLGDRALWSKLNYVLTFTRDLALHGLDVSEPVLRISCESAFELVPQIAALARGY